MKGQIEKRGDGTYRLRWYTGRVDGKRQYNSKTIRGTKKQAEKALRDVLARADRGLAVPTRVPTVAEFAETWEKGEAAAKLRARTLRDYQWTLKKHVLPVLGKLPLNALHTARIEAELVAPLRERGKVRMAQLCVAVLSKLYRSALKDPALGLMGNPCSGVEVGQGKRRDIEPLDTEERAAFRAAIAGTEHEALLLLLMGTGLRPGEARALGWEHLDLAVGELRVERAADDQGEIGEPKTARSRRMVPLTAEIRATLRALHLRRGRPAAGLVFHEDGKVLPQRVVLSGFRAALKRAGIAALRFGIGGLRSYDLRHGFGTAGLEAGLDAKDVSILMGHSSTRITQDTYQHVSASRKRDAAERIGGALFGRSDGG